MVSKRAEAGGTGGVSTLLHAGSKHPLVDLYICWQSVKPLPNTCPGLFGLFFWVCPSMRDQDHGCTVCPISCRKNVMEDSVYQLDLRC